MSTSNSLRRAVHYALLTSAAAAISAPAFAQEQNIQEVIVTGSRISSANLEGTTPVTLVTAEDIETKGVTRVEDLIRQLPQAFSPQNSTVSNGADGTARVSLRNLGSNRTLVLIDGRRMPYGGVNSSAADLNQIPGTMVERIEILTGGSSAVYGSDAVAGVVNFIMKKDFEGVEFDAQYGFNQHSNDFGGPGQTKLRNVIATRAAANSSEFALPDDNVTDGESVEFSMTVGTSTDDGRGNITAYASVRDNKAVLQRDRDYSACAIGGTTNLSTSFTCAGSSTSYPGRYTDFGLAGVLNLGPDGVAGTGDEPAELYRSFDFSVDDATNTFRAWNGATDLYNYGPLNYFQRPDRRYTLGAMGHYELAEWADVYTQLMFNDYTSTAQIAPGGAFFETATINCNNPLLPQAQLATIGCTPTRIANGDTIPMYIGRRNVEGGGRRDTFSTDSFRTVLGVRGAISDSWDYDAFAQFSKVKADNYTLNRFHLTRFQNAINVVTDPDTGLPVCAAVLDGSDPSCVPYNPFDPSADKRAALAYLQTPSLEVGRIEQEIYGGSVTGDLGGMGLASPLASDSIRVVFGIEQRTDRLDTLPDSNLQGSGGSSLLMGQGGATLPVSGQIKVTDYFTEVRVPLVNDRPGAQSLSIDGAYRYSDYDNLSTDTYKIGAEWAPIEDIRFRGSFQRAVRAANIVELFSAQGFSLFDIAGDPCGAEAPNPDATAAECIATGVPAGLVGSSSLDSPAGQYQFLQGGNPELTPEKSDTVTLGLIFQPRFLSKLAVSLDYFDIEIVDTVSSFGASNTLNACYTNNDADACGRISRSAAGQLWVGDGFVSDLNINIGSLSTSGWDLNLTYAGVEMGRAGALNFNVAATYTEEYVVEPGPGIDAYDCVGFYADDCGVPLPDLRAQSRVEWESPWNVDVSLTWRYLSSVEEFRGSSVQLDYELGAQSYFDLAANWRVTEKASMLLGITNVLDDDPPLNSNVGTTGNGNTYPQLYDSLGRFIFLRGRVGF